MSTSLTVPCFSFLSSPLNILNSTAIVVVEMASPPLSYLTYASSIPVAGLVGSFPAGSVCVPYYTPPAVPVGMWCLLCLSGSFEGPCPVAPLGHSTWTGKIVVVAKGFAL